MTKRVATKKMSNEEFCDALEAIGLTNVDRRTMDENEQRFDLKRAASILGISRRAAYYYAFGNYEHNIPAPVTQLLRLLTKLAEVPQRVRQQYGIPVIERQEDIK